MNIQRYIMNFDHSRIANVSKQNRLLSQCAVDLLRVPLNTNFFPAATVGEVYYSAISVLGNWISSITGFADFQGASLPWTLQYSQSIGKSTPHTASCNTFLDALTNGDDDTVITCQDKDASILWLASGWLLMLRWITILQDSSRWRVIDVPYSKILKLYREGVNKYMRRFLLESVFFSWKTCR